jgi:hypothetical protein
MSRFSGRPFDVFLLGVIVALTLSTAYIHYWVGGTMLLLNAAGYLGLAVLTVVTASLYSRALPLALLALAPYAALTIVGWLVMGPYFDVAYLAKGIELVLIGTIAFFLWRHRTALRSSIEWGRSLAARVLGAVRRPAADGATSTEK